MLREKKWVRIRVLFGSFVFQPSSYNKTEDKNIRDKFCLQELTEHYHRLVNILQSLQTLVYRHT